MKYLYSRYLLFWLNFYQWHINRSQCPYIYFALARRIIYNISQLDYLVIYDDFKRKWVLI